MAGKPVVIEILQVPMSVSRLNKHWAIRNQERQYWEKYLLAGCHPNSRAHLKAGTRMKEKVFVRIELHHARFFDDDNKVGCLKPVFDAMKQIGYIYDDKPTYMELVSVTQIKCPQKSAKTLIEISEQP